MASGQETHSHEKTKETHVGKSQEEEDDSKKTNIDNKQADQTGEDRETEAHSVKEKPYASIKEGESETGHHKDEAQEKPMEVAIRNAEEKYAQAKEAGIAALHDVKECVFHGLGAATYYAAAKSLAATDTSLEKGEQVYNYTTEKVRDAGKAALDVAVSVGESAVHYVGEKAKETANELAAYKAVEAKDDFMSSYVGEKAVEAKDKAINVGKDAASYEGEKAIEAKDDFMSSYVGEKAVEAKDKAINVGKDAASYAGEKAIEAKDDFMSSYVGGKAVEAKDKAINVGKDAASYAGEKAIEAKDATLEAGKKAWDVVSKKVSSEASGDDMLLSVDSLKKERDFYLAKLQDIDNVCQYYSSEIEKLPVVSAIQTILEAKNLVALAEAQAMMISQQQQQQQNEQLEVVAAEDKRKSENQKRKNISSDEVDAAANTKLSPRQRISDASSDVVMYPALALQL